jgi:hypothetical protein
MHYSIFEVSLTLPSGEITLREGEKVNLDSWTWRRDRNQQRRDEASRKNPLSFGLARPTSDPEEPRTIAPKEKGQQ